VKVLKGGNECRRYLRCPSEARSPEMMSAVVRHKPIQYVHRGLILLLRLVAAAEIVLAVVWLAAGKPVLGA
jgi:hypothetical protein